MGKKKKIKKSIESIEKRIKEHKEKIGKYEKESGKDYALKEYWKREIEDFEEKKEEQIKKLKKKK